MRIGDSMKKLIVIDVGGTTIKYNIWNETTQSLGKPSHIDTPKTLNEFYESLSSIVSEYRNDEIDGVGISIPGAVNQKSGIIGGISAIPYIHNFPILASLEEKLKLKVTMENDANCAALAEVSIGSAKVLKNVVFIVIGTGIGGALVIDRKIVHGVNLYAGEFGMMLGENKNPLSLYGTAVHLADWYNKSHNTNLSGREVLDLANKGDGAAIKYSDIMYNNLAQSIYNIQFAIDPEAIIIGGGVSKNEAFIDNINKSLIKLTNSLGNIPITPKVIAAKYHNDSNLIGAAYNFYHHD